MIIDELYSISDRIIQADLLTAKSEIKVVKKWYKELLTRYIYQRCVGCISWGDVPTRVALEFANTIDEPFLQLLRTIQIHRLPHNIHSLIRMWQRLKGLGEQHLITYIRTCDLVAHLPKTIYGDDVIAMCYKGKDGLDAYMRFYRNGANVERHLRELLECSRNADIKEKFIAWVKTNHPDKGGDHDKFIEVKSVYDEWKRIQEEVANDKT